MRFASRWLFWMQVILDLGSWTFDCGAENADRATSEKPSAISELQPIRQARNE
jgi:hypothetical protein